MEKRGQVLNYTGGVAQSYVYDSFGSIVSQNGSVVNPYSYTGREFDSESGLYYYRARYYDAKIGRFLQEDPLQNKVYPYKTDFPLGLIGQSDFDGIEIIADIDVNLMGLTKLTDGKFTLTGQNLYHYSLNNPINLTDPSGENPAMGRGLARILPIITGAAKQCKNIRCITKLHGPHHPFGWPFNEKRRHVQIICYIKGKRDSTFINWHIPY